MLTVNFTKDELKDDFYCVREQIITSCNDKHIERFKKVIDKMRKAIDRKKKEDIAKTINTMLDLREFLDMKGDISISSDGKIKIYKPELNMVRIDIKEMISKKKRR